MAGKRLVIVVHGVGDQPAGYSQEWAKLIQGTEPSANTLEFREVYWQDSARMLEDKYFHDVSDTPLFKEIRDGEAFKAVAGVAKTHVSDVYFYIANPEFADEARRKVRAAFRAGFEGDYEHVYIVSHSLGTVIAYDAMRSYDDLLLRPEKRLKALITVASPLAVGIFHRSRGPDGGYPLPVNVRRWINVWNSLDPIAATVPLQNQRNGVSTHVRFQHDFGVQGVDPHGMDGYLKVSTAIDSIRGQLLEGVV